VNLLQDISLSMRRSSRKNLKTSGLMILLGFPSRAYGSLLIRPHPLVLRSFGVFYVQKGGTVMNSEYLILRPSMEGF
jgi:hypothetical protein